MRSWILFYWNGKPPGDFQPDSKCSDVHLRKMPVIAVWVRTGVGEEDGARLTREGLS